MGHGHRYLGFCVLVMGGECGSGPTAWGFAGTASKPTSQPLQQPCPLPRQVLLGTHPCVHAHHLCGDSSSGRTSGPCSPCNISGTGHPASATRPGRGAALGSAGSSSSCRRWSGNRARTRWRPGSAAGAHEPMPPAWLSAGGQRTRAARVTAGEQRPVSGCSRPLCVPQLTW